MICNSKPDHCTNFTAGAPSPARVTMGIPPPRRRSCRADPGPHQRCIPG